MNFISYVLPDFDFFLTVVGCYKEPIPGWIDNIYGPTGTIAGEEIKLYKVLT